MESAIVLAHGGVRMTYPLVVFCINTGLPCRLQPTPLRIILGRGGRYLHPVGSGIFVPDVRPGGGALHIHGEIAHLPPQIASEIGGQLLTERA